MPASVRLRLFRRPRLWLLWFAGLVGAVVSTAFAGVYEHFPGDPLVARQIQAVRLSDLAWLGDLVYAMGGPLFAVTGVAAAVVVLCTRQRLAALFLLAALSARVSVNLLKDLAERPRPTPDLVRVAEQAGGFSFPSGHVLGSVLLWGFLCYVVTRAVPHRGLRLAVQALSVAIILLTGLQRVYAGAHWPSDVVGGYLWGGLLLFVIVRAYELCEDRLRRLPRVFVG